MNWYLDVLKKYAVFKGRARRKEYWIFVLVNCLFAFFIALMEEFFGETKVGEYGVLSILYLLAVAIPSLAVGVRRLHDTGRSGWWMLIGLVPIVGAIVLLVFMVRDSNPGENIYGPNPKEATAA